MTTLNGVVLNADRRGHEDFSNVLWNNHGNNPNASRSVPGVCAQFFAREFYATDSTVCFRACLLFLLSVCMLSCETHKHISQCHTKNY